MTLGRLSAGLQQLGHRVNLFRPRQCARETPSHNGSFVEHLLPGMRVPMYRELHMGLPATRRFTGCWSARRPDVLYVATEGPLGWSAVRAAGRLKIPVVSGFHTNFHTYSKHYRMGWLEPLVLHYLRNLHRRTGCTLAPTRALAAQLREQGFGRVEVVQRGVDTGLFTPLRRSKALRQSWGAGPQDPVCLYVGRIAAEKNIREAVNAFLAVQARQPRARFILVGDGPLRETLAREHPGFVFCGLRHGEDLAQHYASGDLFLFPSRSETFGNVVTEAMASGLAVVAYNEAAAGEHIHHLETGVLVDTPAPTAFTDAAVALSQRPAAFRAIGNAAAQYTSRLDWSSVVARFAELLREQVEAA
ncbi:MAG: glycosyltransferase family 1 protein [Thiogranum sp.]|nr:glycosyltransferase family 1 protein [Thiogranum sp.]